MPPGIFLLPWTCRAQPARNIFMRNFKGNVPRHFYFALDLSCSAGKEYIHISVTKVSCQILNHKNGAHPKKQQRQDTTLVILFFRRRRSSGVALEKGEVILCPMKHGRSNYTSTFKYIQLFNEGHTYSAPAPRRIVLGV